MKKTLNLVCMLLLAVCVSSCASKQVKQEEPMPVQEETIVEPVLEPSQEQVSEPEADKVIQDAIQTAVKEDKKEFTIDLEKLAKQNLFKFDSYKIAEENFAGLDVVAKFLKDTPNVIVKVEGHTDNIGSKEYNQNLSQKRAESIANYFIEKGVDSSKVTTEGFGDSKPIATNKTKEGRKQNRRTELKFKIIDVEQTQPVQNTSTSAEVAK